MVLPWGNKRKCQGNRISFPFWPLEKEIATHSSILAWRIPWMEELGGLQSTGHKESGTTEQLNFRLSFLALAIYNYCSLPLSMVSPSVISVTCDQPWSENSKWESPGINNFCFKLCAILSSMMKSHAILLYPAQDLNHPFVHPTPLIIHFM